jgi:soluble lytic murein transglycosylase-like protein
MRFLGTLLLLSTASVCLAGEYAVLSTGSRLRADRHEADGGKVRLYSGAGYIELDANQISSFETFADPAPPPPASAQPAADAAAPAQPARTPVELADAAADRYGLPRWLVRSIMSAESANQPNAVSPKGAIGLMQLMPATARELGADPRDPAQNVDAGARYLRDLLLRYDYHLWHAVAAYNAGAGAVQKYNGIPPYRETINYVNRIDRAYRKSSQ